MDDWRFDYDDLDEMFRLRDLLRRSDKDNLFGIVGIIAYVFGAEHANEIVGDLRYAVKEYADAVLENQRKM